MEPKGLFTQKHSPIDTKRKSLDRDEFIRVHSNVEAYKEYLLSVQHYAQAHAYINSLVKLSGFFSFSDKKVSKSGQWEKRFVHKLKDSKMLSPFDIPLDELKNVRSKKVTWRIYFNLVKALKKEKVLTGWTYMAQSTRKINNKETFGIFADKTFSKNDTVGFLRGKVIYTQPNE